MAHAPLPSADLHYWLVAQGGIQHGLSFHQIVGNGFLAPNVFGRLARGDKDQGVPMVRRANNHSVKLSILEQTAKITIPFGCWLAGGNRLGRAREQMH